MTSEEMKRLTEEILEIVHNPWFFDTENSYVASLMREVKGEIPHYPKFLMAGGDAHISPKKLYKIGSAVIMEDDFKHLGYLPRQILLEDGRGMDSSSGKPFDELLESVKAGSSLNVSSNA